MKLPIFTVDAFADRPFDGNPAAIIPLTQQIDESLLQKIASEINLSETAYIYPIGIDGQKNKWTESESTRWIDGNRFSLRWFTPLKEVILCGHATLASAHTIFFCLGNKTKEIKFETLSGVLTVKREPNNFLVMNFPANPPKDLNSNQNLLLNPLVEAAVTQSKSKIKEVKICSTLKYLLIRFDDSLRREDLENVKPNFSEMCKVHDGSLVMGVILTIAGDVHLGGNSKYHVFSRFLAPLYDVNEDPVTGSAHTVLGPYWTEEFGIKELMCRQCCQRGGDVVVCTLDDGRVELKGVATTVISGHINV